MRGIDQKTMSLYMRKYIFTVSRATGSDIEDFDKILKEITGEKHVASALLYGARFIEGVSIQALFDLFTRFGEEISELLNIRQALNANLRKIRKLKKKEKDIPKKLDKETEKLEKFYNKGVKRVSKFSGFNKGAKFKHQYSRINNLIKGNAYDYRGLMYDDDYDDDYFDYDDYETAAMHKTGLDLSFEGLMGNTRRGGPSKKSQKGLMPDYNEEDDEEPEEDEGRLDQLENMILKLTGVVTNMQGNRMQSSNVPLPAYDEDDEYEDSYNQQSEAMSNMMDLIGALSSQVANITNGLNSVVERLNEYDEPVETVTMTSAEIVEMEEDEEENNGSLVPRNH